MSPQHKEESCEGFTIHTLANEKVSLSMAPELGGRIVSLRDKQADREWLDGWEPASERRLSHPFDPHDYQSSNGAGVDECLPTILPCEQDGVEFGDHGELWQTSPLFTHYDNRLSCLWELNDLPLVFQRSISLVDDTFILDYQLKNLAESVTPFLWAWHPLFKLEKGDRLLVDPSLSQCRTPQGQISPWPSPEGGQDLSVADTGTAEPPSTKVFLGPLEEGKATLQGQKSELTLSWPADLFPWAGIWITRGGWKGLHHWAVEPTNAPVDHLSKVSENPQTQLKPLETRNWRIEIVLSCRL